MPEEEKKPDEEKPKEGVPPPAATPPAEVVQIEPQKEVNPLEDRIAKLEARWLAQDEKEKAKLLQEKEAKHESAKESNESSTGNVGNDVLQKAKGNEEGGNVAREPESSGVSPKPKPATGPAKRKHHFRLRGKRTG